MAKGAAFKIEQFMQEIEKTMRASTQTPDIVSSGLTEAYEFELIKLLKVAPAITAAAALDANGRERFKVSRIQMVRPEDLRDRADDEAFRRARGDASFFGPVYFVRESEPYAHIAVPIKRFAEVVGVLIAEVNLKHVWNVVSQIQAGQMGYAYVVSGEGDLIAHPDISLVLKGRNLKDLVQVQAALAGAPGPFAAQPNFAGHKVFAAYAVIPDLGWAVLVERPAAEAYAPLYASVVRSGVLLLIGLGMAVLASLLIGFRVVRPLQALRQGAARIGAGALDHRIDIQTGDELEVLADEFNQMTAKLRESYANIERVSQLKRFFSPQLADLIVSSGEAKLMESHRREITVVFCDLRNFTAFSSIAEPEETMRVLQEYYRVLGSLLRRFEATIEHFAGDGLMAFFNDPLPCPDPEARAVRMAVAMQHDVGELIEAWRKRDIKLGFGIGISSGYATLGHIGSEEQFHYAAIGSVANLASRLCDEARSGQILITEAVCAAVEELAEAERIGGLSLKGFPKPVPVLQVVGLKERTSA
ncbi:MAG: cache domain-containing protein [Proteobacteria bacterium]|nr:cache domain-containing protein [Pseudomonadota bacterium]